ncbi:DNA-protecting protein DprA [Microbacterium esteraromaticum]|uniref:DNA-protecting protein DprA n=1 Tax=Microbacterium esteraromaticum TaxID=57043 RepID=A0A7D8AI53_9MICO|nr:DNA-processing protein DprA [Microbacterium esteraromaticum]QMU98082.1 DNA-protecting protein DprA [Microbacterium esteraromaticum]
MIATGLELIDDTELIDAARLLRPDADPVEVAARVAWSVLIEPGDGIAGALLQELGAIEALRTTFGESRLAVPGVVPSKALSDAMARWRPRARTRAVRDAVLAARSVGARLLLPGDEQWPEGLQDLDVHSPVLLWARGDAEGLRAGRAVAIVGARAATGYGESVAAELSGDLAAGGVLVVSGGAYGIDGAAHRAALGAGGATAAFLAGGVDRAYPIGHQQLFDRIRQAGVVLSEVPCGSAPTKWRFLARNRLIAAAGLATVVVEAGWRSGTLNTAGHASSLGRPLGAVPGPVTSAASAGCHRLLREFDAVCVTSAQEVRELWGETDASAAVSAPPDHDRTRLLDAMSARSAREVPDIARRSGLSIERVRALLGLLALDGCAAQRESGWVRLG